MPITVEHNLITVTWTDYLYYPSVYWYNGMMTGCNRSSVPNLLPYQPFHFEFLRLLCNRYIVPGSLSEAKFKPLQCGGISRLQFENKHTQYVWKLQHLAVKMFFESDLTVIPAIIRPN